MARTVICISHADGAGGREIGMQLAESTGFKYVDDGIVVDAARSKGLYPEAVSQAESRTAKRSLEVDFNRFEKTEALRTLIREAILTTAEEGNVVIVAHAASYALTDRDDVLRVLVTASTGTREARVGAADGLDAKAAGKALKESDKGRASYLRSFYGVDHEASTDYDLVLNTDRLTSEEAVKTIAAVATT